jgi:hypothetical protein
VLLLPLLLLPLTADADSRLASFFPGGISKPGFWLKKPKGLSINPVVSTGMTGKSSGRTMCLQDSRASVGAAAIVFSGNLFSVRTRMTPLLPPEPIHTSVQQIQQKLRNLRRLLPQSGCSRKKSNCNSLHTHNAPQEAASGSRKQTY